MLGMGLPEETQLVLPGDELSPRARGCIWMQPFTWGQRPCPEAVGTIISQDNEQLQGDERPVTRTQKSPSSLVPKLDPKSAFGRSLSIPSPPLP